MKNKKYCQEAEKAIKSLEAKYAHWEETEFPQLCEEAASSIVDMFLQEGGDVGDACELISRVCGGTIQRNSKACYFGDTVKKMLLELSIGNLRG